MTNEIDLQEVISDYNDYISNIPSGSEYIYTRIRNGEIQEVIQPIINFSEGIGWIISVNNYLKTIDVALGIDENILQNILLELNNALDKQDFYLVADIFEYEIKDFFAGLSKIKINS